MPDAPTTTLRLGPKAIARLAILGDALDAHADTIEIEVRTNNARKYDPTPANYTPSAKLKRAAARGVARLVAAENSTLSRITPDVAVARLVKLGVPEDVAASVAAPLVNARVLAGVELRPEQTEQAITALIVGRQYSAE